MMTVPASSLSFDDVEYLKVTRRGRFPGECSRPLQGGAAQPVAALRLRECPECLGISPRVLTRDNLTSTFDDPLDHARADDRQPRGQSLQHRHGASFVT